jgi:hypothetical protein
MPREQEEWTCGAVRAAGILLLPSLALLTEGTTRFVTNEPGASYAELSNHQRLNLICAVFYAIVGFLGQLTMPYYNN